MSMEGDQVMPVPSAAHRARDDEHDMLLHRSAERAVQWILHSGIYISEEGHPHRGAMHSHYDASLQRHELIYAEITGYATSLFSYLSARQGDSLMSHARASGEWLVNWAERNSGMVSMGVRRDREVREVYAFDNGICCKGLMDLYALCGDERYLRCATRIADWLVNQALNPDGSVKPLFALDSGRFIEVRTPWYKVSGSFHAKIAMSLLLLYGTNKDAHLRDAAVRICEWTIAQQQPDGSFPANRSVRATNLHFHCYTVEALLHAYACLGTARFVDAAERAMRWVMQIQQRDGYVPRWQRRLYLRDRPADVQAQVLRILCLMQMLRPRQELTKAISLASQGLLRMQATGHDVRQDGGFFEGDVRRHRVFLRRSSKMTSWTTMFAIQALTLAQQLPDGDFSREAKRLF